MAEKMKGARFVAHILKAYGVSHVFFMDAVLRRALAEMEDFGITRVLSYQAVDALADGSLVRLLRDFETEPTPVHALYPGGRHPPPKLRAFLDELVPRLRERVDGIARSIDGKAL